MEGGGGVWGHSGSKVTKVPIDENKNQERRNGGVGRGGHGK